MKSAILKGSAKVTILSLTIFARAAVRSTDWKGLVPLKSTRVDVERLLGSPLGTDECRCKYESPSERVDVLYSGEPCKENSPYGYNVPRDTVLELHLRPKTVVTIDSVHVDQGFKKVIAQDFPFVTYYGNKAKGIIIEADSQGKTVLGITYIPVADDTPRCGGERIFDPAGPVKVDEYSGLDPLTENQHLDQFGRVLQQQPAAIGYIVMDETKDSQTRRRISDYLSKKFGLDSTRIVMVGSGHRERHIVELFLWPPRWYPAIDR